jgi:ribosomal protein L11 methyltransferase
LIKISPQILLCEPGAEYVRGGVIALPQIASSAFGDGSHPTTRLCAGAVDLLCRQNQPRVVLDVGTGTGVLARIARARGCAKVVATDIDEQALESALQNSRLDAYPPDLLVTRQPPDHWGACFDLVIANILEGVLTALAPSLNAALAPGGRLLLSGFTPRQIPALRVSFESLGLDYVTASYLDEWALLMFRKP